MPGDATIWGLKNHVYAAGTSALAIHNYGGRVFFGGEAGNEGGPALITQTGKNPLLLMLVGCDFYKSTPPYLCKVDPGVTLLAAQNAEGAGDWDKITVMEGGFLPRETLRKIPFIDDPERRVYNIDDETPLLKTVNEDSVKQALPTELPHGQASLQDIAAAYDNFRRLWNFELAWLYTGNNAGTAHGR